MNDLGIKKFIQSMKRREKKADRIADAMVECLGKRPDSHMLHMMLPRKLGAKLMPRFRCEYLSSSPLLSGIFDGFIQAHLAPEISRILDLIWEKQKDKVDGYGDADYFFTKYRKNDRVRVSILHDIVCCSEDNLYVIIEDLERERVHIRLIVDDKKSDYPRKPYPTKLCMRFYRDRDFNMEYVEKWHMTNLGGVYGDIRDTGYVLSYDKTSDYKTERNLSHINEISHVAWLLKRMKDQIEEES